MSTTPDFIERNPLKIQREVRDAYQDASGKPVQPAQPEMLLIDGIAYRESLVRSQVQDAALQMLVDFSRAPILDYLGALVGVERLPAVGAKTTIRFERISNGIPFADILIPQGTRVASQDGNVVFETIQETSLIWSPLSDHIDIACEAVEPGAGGNGFQAGDINTLLDSLSDPEVTVTNTTSTAGGSDVETDDNLRQRIKLAPASFSVAGPRDSYIYWTRTANANIVDAALTVPTPGTVRVFSLYIPDGSTVPQETPTEVLNEVDTILNDEKIRPICDTVEVVSPTIVPNSIEVGIIKYVGYDTTLIEQQVQARLEALAAARGRKLGADLTINMIVGACMSVPGVYNVFVPTPVADLIIEPTEVVAITSITCSVAGTENG